jgi:PAS domain S-box-containing protein
MQLTDLSFLFHDNPSPMWIFELATLRILKVNKAAIERYGYPEHEFLTMNTRELLQATELKKFDTQFYQNGTGKPKRHGIIHSGIWKHQNKKHELIYADITSQDVRFEGRHCRLVVAADGTEKVHYREEATWTKNNLEALINNTKDQIWSLDKETRYVYMNKAYRTQISQLTGVEPKKGSYSYLHPGYSEQIIEEWKQYYSRALAGERYSIVYESIEPLTQQVLSFEISFNPIYKTKRDIKGVGCFARNITEWLEKEKAIIDQNERLRHIASLTSHELRRPVASMLGLINIMDRENFFNPDNKEIIGHLLTVGKEIDEVIRLIIDKSFINDLLKNKYQLP